MGPLRAATGRVEPTWAVPRTNGRPLGDHSPAFLLAHVTFQQSARQFKTG